MHATLFQSVLGITDPWFVKNVDLDVKGKVLTIQIDFARGSRFGVEPRAAAYPVHDTLTRRYSHLNLVQHECYLEVRVPRVKLPAGGVKQVGPPWAGKLNGITLLFEALVISLCREMPSNAVAQFAGLNWHKVNDICFKYFDLELVQADFSEVKRLAVDETSRVRRHNYVTLLADAYELPVLFMTEGRGADTLGAFVQDLKAHGGDPMAIETVSIDMSLAYIKGVQTNLPNATIAFDKFHVIAHASKALDKTRRIEQRSDTSLKGLRWSFLKGYDSLKPQAQSNPAAVLAQVATKRTARAWAYREHLREIFGYKQINVMRTTLWEWTVNVMRFKVEPMTEVAKMIRAHLEGIVVWVRTRRSNGFLEAINGLLQAAKRKARGYRKFTMIRADLLARRQTQLQQSQCVC